LPVEGIRMGGWWQPRYLWRRWIVFGGRDIGMNIPPCLASYEAPKSFGTKGKLWCTLAWRGSEWEQWLRHHPRWWIFGQSLRLWASSRLGQELHRSCSCRNHSWSSGHHTSDLAVLSHSSWRSERERALGLCPWVSSHRCRKLRINQWGKQRT
jgi:hypothetical protein